MLPVYYDTHRCPHGLGPSHVPQLIDLEQFMNPLLIIDIAFSFVFGFIPAMPKTMSSATAAANLFATQCASQLSGFIRSYAG